LLELARDGYRRAIATHHPDRGGDTEKAAALNLSWSFVRRCFARNGMELE